MWVKEETERREKAEAAEKERLRLEALAEAERKETERLAEKKRKEKAAEERLIKIEFELMLDADLEMMAFVNEERYLAERESANMSREEEFGLHIREDPEEKFLVAQAAIREEWLKRNTEEPPEKWAVYEDGEELDPAEELLQEQLQLQQEEQEEQKEREERQRQEEQHGQEQKDTASGGGEVKAGEEGAHDAEQTAPQIIGEGTRSSLNGSAKLKKNPRSALRELYETKKGGKFDHEGDAFRKKVVSVALSASQKRQAFDVDDCLDAELIHSNLPGAYTQGGATRPQVRSPQEEAENRGLDRGQVPKSPRAKVGMRVLSSRAPVTASIAWGLPRDAVIICSDKDSLSLSSLAGSSRVRTRVSCPLTQALGQWQVNYRKQMHVVERAQQEYQADLKGETNFAGGLSRGEPPVLEEEELDQLSSLGVKRDISLVESVELKVEGLTTIAFLRSHRHVKNLNLNVNRLKTLDGLQYLPSVEVLQVRDNALTDISALASTAKLVDVSLDLNSLSDISALCHHHSLSKLTVRDNQLTTLETFHGCNFPKLTRLELYQNELTSVPEHSLCGLVSLTHLDLGRNKLQFVSGAALSQCVHLETLVLSQNGLEAVPSPLHLPHLKHLWLGQNKLCDLQPWVPYQQSGANVAENDRDSKNNDAWKWPLFCPLLESLHLSENQITAILDTSLMLCLHLRSLHLSFNPITSTRALYAASLCPYLSNLEIQEMTLTASNRGREVRERTYEWVILNFPSLRTYCGDSFNALEVSGERFESKKARVDAAARKYRAMGLPLSLSSCLDADFANEEEEELLSGLTIPERRGLFLSLLGLHTNAACDLDPSLVQMLDSVRLEEHAVIMREKTRKNFVSTAVRQITNQQQSSGEPNFRDSRIAALYSSGVRAPAEIEAAVGPGERDFAESLLDKHTNSLLNWSSSRHPTSVPQEVTLSARLFTEAHQNDISSSRRELFGKNDYQKVYVASSLVQAIVRGFITRRRLSKALIEAEYRDDELDRIVGGDVQGDGIQAERTSGDGLGDSFDLDDFLETGIDVPELDAAFFTHSGHKAPATSQHVDTATKRASSDVVGPTASELDQDATTPRGSTSSKRVSSVRSDAEGFKKSEAEESISQLEERDKLALASELAELATTSANGTPMVYGDHRRNRKANLLLQETSTKLALQSSKAKEQVREDMSTRIHQSTRDILDKPSVKGSGRNVSSLGYNENTGDEQDMFIGSPPLMPSSWANDGKNMPKLTNARSGLGSLDGSPLGNRGDSAREGQLNSTTSSPFNKDGAIGEEEDGFASIEDRPMSAMTDNSTGTTPRSQLGDPFGRVATHDSGVSDSAFMRSPGALYPDQVSDFGGQNFRKQQQADQLAQEWGIKDPKVLALMVKRSKQLKKGGSSGRSLKGATPSASGMAAHSIKSSGTFGGKPKSVKGNNKTAGRKGVPPAWAKPGGP